MKICSMCKKNKQLKSFYADARKKDWYRSACKMCYRKKYKYIHTQEKTIYKREWTKTLKWQTVSLLSNAKWRSKRFKLDCDLDNEWITERLKKWTCELTWIKFNREEWYNKRASPFSPSIDKINPNKWYTKDNCRIICFCVNMARSDWWDEVLLKMCKAVVKAITYKY